jgi:hypothetical protein
VASIALRILAAFVAAFVNSASALEAEEVGVILQVPAVMVPGE